MQNSAAPAALGDRLAAADTAARSAADTLWDTVAGIAAAHSTAGIAAGFVGAQSRPCRRGSLRQTACRTARPGSFQPLQFLPPGFRGA